MDSGIKMPSFYVGVYPLHGLAHQLWDAGKITQLLLGLNFLTHKDPGYLAQSSSKLMISLEFYLTLHNKSLNQNSKGDGFIFQYNYKE